MPPALTSWVAPVTGVLADCDGLSSEERWNKSIGILQDAGWQADDWGEHPGGAERAIAPTGLKGPNGEQCLQTCCFMHQVLDMTQLDQHSHCLQPIGCNN